MLWNVDSLASHLGGSCIAFFLLPENVTHTIMNHDSGFIIGIAYVFLQKL